MDTSDSSVVPIFHDLFVMKGLPGIWVPNYSHKCNHLEELRIIGYSFNGYPMIPFHQSPGQKFLDLHNEQMFYKAAFSLQAIVWHFLIILPPDGHAVSSSISFGSVFCFAIAFLSLLRSIVREFIGVSLFLFYSCSLFVSNFHCQCLRLWCRKYELLQISLCYYSQNIRILTN